MDIWYKGKWAMKITKEQQGQWELSWGLSRTQAQQIVNWGWSELSLAQFSLPAIAKQSWVE